MRFTCHTHLSSIVTFMLTLVRAIFRMRVSGKRRQKSALQLICEGLLAHRVRVSITPTRTVSAKLVVPHPASPRQGWEKTDATRASPVSHELTRTNLRVPSYPVVPAGNPRFVRDPEWLNWLYPCHVACLERSTERSNSTLNDCNRRYFRALQATDDYALVSEGKTPVRRSSKG